MFFSLCFLLTLASYGFSGVQSDADLDGDDYLDGYGARSLWAGNADDSAHQRANKEVSIEMVNEGMDKVVALASALAKGASPANKRSGVFLASEKPEMVADIQRKMKAVQQHALKMEKAL